MPGTIQIKITNPMYEDWQESIEIGTGENKNISPELTKKTGSLIIKSDPIAAEVEIDGIIKGLTPLTLENIEFGTHNIKIFKKDFQTEIQKVEFASTSSKTIVVTLERANGEITISGTPAGACVLINQHRIGTIPLENFKINKGSYEMIISAKGYEKQVKAISISPNEKKSIDVQLKMKSNKKALVLSLFVPGSGQDYMEKPLKANLFPILEIGALFGAYVFNKRYNSAVKDYNTIKGYYSNEIEQTYIDIYYSQMKTKYKDVESEEKKRNLCIGVAVGVWLWNVVDAAFFGPMIENKTSMAKISEKKLKIYSDHGNGLSCIGISYNF